MLAFLATPSVAQYDPAPAWEAFLPSKSWTAIASSSDGFGLVASTATRPDVADGGSLYTSADGGVTWLLNSEGTVGGRKAWTAVASSDDGQHLAGAARESPVRFGNCCFLHRLQLSQLGERIVTAFHAPQLQVRAAPERRAERLVRRDRFAISHC